MDELEELNRPPDSYLFSLRYLVLINLMTCGVELCSSAAFGYLPPLLLEAGVSETSMSMIISIGPMIALFLLPLMGTMSDNCTSRYGRRRPFLFGMGILCILSMICLAFPLSSESTVAYFVSPARANFIMLSVAIITFDLSTQLSFTPMESLLSDPCRSDEHHNKSFVVFTFLLSVGACVGYWLLSIDWDETALASLLGGQRQCIFVLLCIIFTLSSGISLSIAYDPQLRNSSSTKSDVFRNKSNSFTKLTSNHNTPLPVQNGVSPAKSSDTSRIFIPPSSSAHPTSILPRANFFHRLMLPFSIFKCLCPRLVRYYFRWIGKTTSDTLASLTTMPRALRKLWLANLLSNTAVLGFRLYFTDYVGETLYKGNPEADEGSMDRNLYDLGIRMGSWGLFLHSVVSAITSLFLKQLMSGVGERWVFMLGMLVFTLLTGMMLFVRNISFTILLAAGTGLGTAITSTVPYTLLSCYHENSEIFFSDLNPEHSHLHGKGTDFSLLDSGFILSEILASIFFGILVELTSTTVTYIVCAFLFSWLSCFAVWFIEYPSSARSFVS
ncbi:solute carrier family 45 member 3-like [Apostichopus japonicus]|uniref:solute carrier family 45 member 3-like n=1 Tax=Stichopus japonicus TaxID=307972 RepID=UPI003AB7D829